MIQECFRFIQDWQMILALVCIIVAILFVVWMMVSDDLKANKLKQGEPVMTHNKEFDEYWKTHVYSRDIPEKAALSIWEDGFRKATSTYSEDEWVSLKPQQSHTHSDGLAKIVQAVEQLQQQVASLRSR